MNGFLTDVDFRVLAKNGHAVVDPFDPNVVRPSSIDLHLSNVLYRYRLGEYTLGQPYTDDDYVKEAFSDIELEPGESCFVGVRETILIPQNFLGFVFARSSITRLGLIIPPVYMNPGYGGQLPLTIINSSAIPVRVVPHVRVAQLLCVRLGRSPELGYDELEGSKYHGEAVSPSLLHTDEDIRSALDDLIREMLPAQYPENV